MAAYFILYFQARNLNRPTIQKWLLEEGHEAGPDTPLFSYLDDGKEGRYCSPVPGIFKVHLCKEGETLKPGSEIAVLSVDEKIAPQLAAAGHGKVLTPVELDKALEHAGASSIRLPPEE